MSQSPRANFLSLLPDRANVIIACRICRICRNCRIWGAYLRL